MKRIRTLRALCEVAKARRSVVCPNTWCFRGPSPAAWIQNQMGFVLNRLIESGMYLYTPKGKNK